MAKKKKDKNISKIFTQYEKLCNSIEKYFEPILNLYMRFLVGSVFFKSGKLKFGYYLDGNWDITIALFREVHPVPFMTPEFAAIIGTFNEVTFPILLFFGIFSRFSAAVLLFMTIVIEVTYLHSIDHFFWGVVLLYVIIRGPLSLSFDHYFYNYIRKLHR